MATFLVWNVQRKPLEGLVVRLAEQHKVSVLILVERPDPDDLLLRALQGVGRYHRVSSHERFGVYSRFRDSYFHRLTPPVEDDRVDFWRLQPPRATTEILLVVVHGLDRVHYIDDRRELFFNRVVENIRWAEGSAGHRRTVVVGDFNANPFEQSIGGIRGLHAVGVRDIQGRDSRRVMGRDYNFFYNPMWACYGGSRNSPPATYYYNGSDVHEFFWHMLDQVVLRPELVPLFAEQRLRILRTAGPADLLTPFGLPDAINASDHLPILFELKLSGGTTNA
jgi:hypothetical protein